MTLFISVVIPAKNEEHFIRQCLASLAKQTYPADHYEVLVIDNNSTDKTAAIAQEMGVKVIAKPSGRVGAVRNFGASQARGNVLAFIDADCLVDPEWLTRAAALVSEKPNAVFGGGCLLREDANWLEKNWLLGEGNKRVPKHLIGASILISRPTLEGVSGFNELVTSGEDTQLSEDLQRQGLEVVMTSKLSVTHLGNATSMMSFLKRQIWHSENYLLNIDSSFKDPTFFLLTLNILLWAISLLDIMFFQSKYIIIIILLILSIPLTFSIKRILRAGIKDNLSVRRLLIIYFIDSLYVFSRTIGLLKSLVGRTNRQF